jgi:hypothetical protein
MRSYLPYQTPCYFVRLNSVAPTDSAFPFPSINRLGASRSSMNLHSGRGLSRCTGANGKAKRGNLGNEPSVPNVAIVAPDQAQPPLKDLSPMVPFALAALGESPSIDYR